MRSRDVALVLIFILAASLVPLTAEAAMKLATLTVKGMV
jgi:hypothetical protein